MSEKADVYATKPWCSRYPHGLGEDVTPTHGTVLEQLSAVARRKPDGVCLDYFDSTLTFGEVEKETDALAVALRAIGLAPGERVALYSQNVPQYVLALLACWKAGGVAVPVNPMLKAAEVRKILVDSGARVLVALETLFCEHGRAAVAGTAVGAVITTSELDYQHAANARVFGPVTRDRQPDTEDLRELVARYRGSRLDTVSPSADDVAVLTYTSGTTGAPKGAMNTHRNVVLGGQFYRDWFALTDQDRILGIAPLFHVTGLTGHIAATFASGAALQLAYRFEAQMILELIRAKRPTFTVGAITAFVALAGAPGATRDDLASLRVIASGGAPVAAALVESFQRRFGQYIYNVYGMTETTAPTHAVPPGAAAPVEPVSGALSVGVVTPGCRMRVVDEQGTPLPAGEVGELQVGGPRIVPGYWNNPEATAAAFDAEWLLTGDVGFVDEGGWFYVVDRKKDVIIASGYKVWPREVEDVLYAHPAVREAAVVGVPDAYRGESVKAFVSLQPETTARPEDLVTFARERLAAYKYPREVQIVTEIPKTVTGKVLRRELRAESSR